MTGINILAEYTAGGTPVAGIVISCILVVLGFIIFIAGLAGGYDDVTGVGCLLVAISIVLLFIIIFTAEPEHTRYKVTISDEVNLVEFLERYEILDTEGEIYTIREVTPDA